MALVYMATCGVIWGLLWAITSILGLEVIKFNVICIVVAMAMVGSTIIKIFSEDEE